MHRKLAVVAALAAALLASPAYAQKEFGSPELIAAANKEGKLVFYTANIAEAEQQLIKAFNQRFPGIKVEMVRAPGGQLITRVKTEAAAGKLSADVISHSDRAVLAEMADLFMDYAPPNAADYPRDALVRGEILLGPMIYSIAFNKMKDGAPIETVFPPEGVPILAYADGIPKTAKNPNAARLFMNWRLSAEGQAFQIKELGQITSLRNPPFYPKGWDPKVVKTWTPNSEQFVKLHKTWVEDWNKTYGYRQ